MNFGADYFIFAFYLLHSSHLGNEVEIKKRREKSMSHSLLEIVTLFFFQEASAVIILGANQAASLDFTHPVL